MKSEFARAVKRALKQSIKGEVNCHIIQETLIIDIYGVNDICYRYTMNNISSEIVQGLTSKTVAYKVTKWYRSYINNLFFL